MTYTKQAIPTAYKGITFRSRLEARWAAMFDLLGWTWEYEPEVDGKYIPDFTLHGPRTDKVFVEVKPNAIYQANKADIHRKAWGAIKGAPLLIVTDELPHAICFDVLAIGYIDDEDQDDFAVLFQPGAERYGREYDFAAAFGAWAGRLTQAYEGNALFEGTMVPAKQLLTLWSRAGNVIQWKPSR